MDTVGFIKQIGKLSSYRGQIVLCWPQNHVRQKTGQHVSREPKPAVSQLVVAGASGTCRRSTQRPVQQDRSILFDLDHNRPKNPCYRQEPLLPDGRQAHLSATVPSWM